MNEVVWNGGYYRVGGTLIYYGNVYTIKELSLKIAGSKSLFDRKRVLVIITEDGRKIEIEERV